VFVYYVQIFYSYTVVGVVPISVSGARLYTKQFETFRKTYARGYWSFCV